MNRKTIQTYIIGGKYKGIKLNLPSLKTTRSSKSILKESLFDTINMDIIDENFVEVFAGSGSIMIEAVSRGAKHGFGTEKDRKAYEILKANCTKVDKEKFTCQCADAFENTKHTIAKIQSPCFIYFDPPFDYRENMEEIYQKCFDLLKNLDENKIIQAIFEHMSILKMPKNIGNFNLQKTKKFGKSSLSYYKI